MSAWASVFASEHFHPWTPEQGQAAFVWTFFGALGQATKTMRFGTGITCPTFRFHPAVVAHAAATTEAMFPGRFYLGLGSGEALNEHVIGGVWPEAPTRLAMMTEAVEIIKKLFTGKVVKHKGEYFTLESAKLYTMPDTPPPIYIATAGPDHRAAHGQDGGRPDYRRRGGRQDQGALRAVRARRARRRARTRRRCRN